LKHRNINELERKTAELRRASNLQRVSVIETDVETGMTFLRLADTELGMGNMERVNRLVGLARKAHEATGKFLAGVQDPEDFERLREKRQGLEEAIRDTERRIR